MISPCVGTRCIAGPVCRPSPRDGGALSPPYTPLPALRGAACERRRQVALHIRAYDMVAVEVRVSNIPIIRPQFSQTSGSQGMDLSSRPSGWGWTVSVASPLGQSPAYARFLAMS